MGIYSFKRKIAKDMTKHNDIFLITIVANLESFKWMTRLKKNTDKKDDMT
jgi:hypothetical protein